MISLDERLVDTLIKLLEDCLRILKTAKARKQQVQIIRDLEEQIQNLTKEQESKKDG